MGNAQSSGRKRGRSAGSAKKSLSPESKRHKSSPVHDDGDEDVTIVSEETAACSMKWKPSSGSKKTQSKSEKSAARGAGSGRGSKQSRDAPLIVATSGPRSRKGDSADMYAVEAVLNKWIGPSDSAERDVFYLIHFKGQKQPAHNTPDESYWQHPTQMRDCKALIAQLDQQKCKPRKQSLYYYTDDSESEQVDQRQVVESREVNGRSLRKRQEPSHSASTSSKGTAADRKAKKKEGAAIGFDRCLEPEQIVGSAFFNDLLVYAVQWQGCKTVDFVVNSLCHQKAPGLVIDYLISKLRNVPAATAADIAL